MKPSKMKLRYSKMSRPNKLQIKDTSKDKIKAVKRLSFGVQSGSLSR